MESKVCGDCGSEESPPKSFSIITILINSLIGTCYSKSPLQSLLPLLEVIPTELSLISLPYTLVLFILLQGASISMFMCCSSNWPCLLHTLHRQAMRHNTNFSEIFTLDLIMDDEGKILFSKIIMFILICASIYLELEA